MDPAVSGSLTAALGALLGAGTTHLAARHRERETRRLTEAREQRNRDADLHREHLRDLRQIVDETVLASSGLREQLRAQMYAVSPDIAPARSTAPKGYSPFRAQAPDRDVYMAAHNRLDDAVTRLRLQVGGDDALLEPIQELLHRSLAAWNAIVTADDPFTERTRDERKAIIAASSTAGRNHRAFENLARRRFSSGPHPDALRSFPFTIAAQRSDPDSSSNEMIGKLSSSITSQLAAGRGRVVRRDAQAGRVLVRMYAPDEAGAMHDLRLALDESVPEWTARYQLVHGHE